MSGKGFRTGLGRGSGERTHGGSYGQRHRVTIRRLSSRERGARGDFERAQALGWKPGPFATPGDARQFLAEHEAKGGEQPRDERGRFAPR